MPEPLPTPKLFDFFQKLFPKKTTLPNPEVEQLKVSLAQSELQKNQLLSSLYNMTNPFIVVDLSRNVLFANHAAEQLLNLPLNFMYGKPISQMLKIYDTLTEVTDLFYCPINTEEAGGKIFTKNSLKVISSSKKESFVNLTSQEIKGDPKLNVGCVLTLIDATRETQLEKMKMDFVSMAAHELRTPLTSMKGYVSVLIEEGNDKLSEDQKMFLRRISISTEQLLGLVENLLNVTRIERGTMALAREQIDLQSIAKQLVMDIGARAKEKNIKLEYCDPTGAPQVIPFIKADKVKITEVAGNLINNAINYTPTGGTVKVCVERKEGDIIFHVTDTGVGINPDAQKHLFTKFYRVINKLGQNSKGTGLGLYISKAIIEMHHGKIWVESEPGRGSTFSFSLPVSDNK